MALRVLKAENERLRSALSQAAAELAEAANILRPNLPRAATIFETAAKRPRDEACPL
jgi:hypothetical protein